MKNIKSKKIIMIIFISILVMMLLTGCTTIEQGEDTSSTSANAKEKIVLKVGDTWTVDGQWNLTIDSVETTEDRNKFSDKEPEQVVIITFSYENLGYEDDIGIMNGLFFDLEPNGDAIVIDSKGEMAYSYPGNITTYAQETPVGAKCMGAQACAGLNNESDTIKMTINKYDSNGKKQKMEFELKVD